MVIECGLLCSWLSLPCTGSACLRAKATLSWPALHSRAIPFFYRCLPSRLPNASRCQPMSSDEKRLQVVGSRVLLSLPGKRGCATCAERGMKRSVGACADATSAGAVLKGSSTSVPWGSCLHHAQERAGLGLRVVAAVIFEAKQCAVTVRRDCR